MSDWPDPDFPAYSRTSRDYLDQPAGAGLVEIEATLAERAVTEAGAIAKGLVERADAEQHRAVLTAIRDDLAGAHDATAGVTWRAKIALLRDEIAARRAGWPARIDKGLMTLADARRRLEALEGVQDRFYTIGLWMGLEDARALNAHVAGRAREEAA